MQDNSNKPILSVPVGPIRQTIAEPPPTEVAGDVFDRQRVMVAWNQEGIENAVAFVLGTGGLGNSVALGLCRLGIKKLFLLDMDFVDASNLNRQLLFSLKDVGKRKVDAAKEGLAHHNLKTEIETIHLDAVTNWGKVVEVCKQCTVVFNCIDYGSVFDYAVNVITKTLGIPYVLGSSYAYTAIVNYFTGKPGDACWTCLNSISEAFVDNQNQPEDIQKWMAGKGLKEDTILTLKELSEFHQENLNMTGADHLIQAALAAIGKQEGIKKEEYTPFVKELQKQVAAELVPSKILTFDSIGFIPKDLHYPTRFVGSWVCVCAGAALMMVNAWAQGVCGVDFPNYNNFTFNSFDAENSKKDGADGKTDTFCVTCKLIAALKKD